MKFRPVIYSQETYTCFQYAFTVGGCNLPYLWIKSMHAGRILHEEMELRTEPFQAIVGPSDFINNVRNMGLFKWLKQYLSGDYHYYFNSKEDPKSFLYYVWNRIFGKKHKESEL